MKPLDHLVFCQTNILMNLDLSLAEIKIRNAEIYKLYKTMVELELNIIMLQKRTK